jgi:hypothetical protein
MKTQRNALGWLCFAGLAVGTFCALHGTPLLYVGAVLVALSYVGDWLLKRKEKRRR